MARSKAKGKGGLKAALASHQSRVSTQARAAASAQAQVAKEKVVNRKAAGQRKKRKHVSSELQPARAFVTEWDNILLIGEGNFSFAVSLVQYHDIPAHRIVATSYDSEDELYRKYPDARSNVQSLRNSGVLVLLLVDARALWKKKELREVHDRVGGFTKVVWNFPHAGAGIQDQDRNVNTNQQLILSFLMSAAPFLAKGGLPGAAKSSAAVRDDETINDEVTFKGPDTQFRGTILITLREAVPYTLWEIPRLAKRPPPNHPRYVQVRSTVFNPSTYPGYEHRRTIGFVTGGNSDITKPGAKLDGEASCRTWEFALKDP